jgi:outer membrane protein assembly factor BamB
MADQNSARSKPASRWRFPAVVILIAAGAIAVVHFSERVDSFYAAYLIPALSLVTAIILLVWFVRFSGFSRKTRARVSLEVVAVLVLGFVAVKVLTRTEGVVNGIGYPRLVWRWSPRAGDDLPQIEASHGVVDLATTKPTDFPQFLGPSRRNAIEDDSIVRGALKPPRLVWRQPIGLGWSSFAIIGDWAVTQEQRGDNELVVCYELKTGKARWVHSRPNTRFVDTQGGDGPRSTPTLSGGRVYAMGATGILDCLDGATGAQIWSRSVLRDRDRNLVYGKSCSPLLVDNLVIVTGGAGGPSVLAFDQKSGAPVWTGGTANAGYASPIIATLAGRRQIVTINAESASGHDVGNGAVLWKFDWPGSMPKVVQPIALEPDRILIAAGYGIGATMLQIRSKGEGFTASSIWTSSHLKPKLSNNVVRGDYVYGFDDGVLTCLDLASGKRKWRGESYGFGQLLLVNDLLLVEAEPGFVALVEARPDEFKEVMRFDALSSRTWSGPALSGQYLLLRNDQEAVCFEWPTGAN